MLKIVFSIWILFLLTGCTNLLFYPSKIIVANPSTYDIGYEDIFVKTADNIQLHGWHLQAEGKPKAKILFFHGNGENISTHMTMVSWLIGYGYDVILVDYRGYGYSQGIPDLKGSINDVDFSIRYVINELLDQNEQLIIMGHSFGGSLSIAALSQNDYQGRVRALLSISAFSDYRDVVQDVLATSWLTWLLQWPLSLTINNDYSPINLVADVSPIPVIIVHGVNDNIVPVYHADELFRSAQAPKYLHKIEGDHNRILLLQKTQDLVLKYLEALSSPDAFTTQ